MAGLKRIVVCVSFHSSTAGEILKDDLDLAHYDELEYNVYMVAISQISKYKYSRGS